MGALRERNFRMDCRVTPGNDGSRQVEILRTQLQLQQSGDVYRTSSRIALSNPSSVSGYIRPPMSWRMMRIDWV